MHPASPALTFDGDTRRGYSRPDEDLLKVLSADTPEGLFSAVRDGAAVTFLGAKFKPRDRDYKGPQYDIYEVAGVVRSRSDQRYQAKRYAFDSDTSLLASVQYVFDRNVRSETRFSNWFTAGGSLFPANIDHLISDN